MFTQKRNTTFLKFLVVLSVLFQCSIYTFRASAQGNSPLSYYGIGEIYSGASANNEMMGGLGVANANGIYINTLNPALLARNRYTAFEVGLGLQYKDLQNTRQQQSVGSGSYQSLTIALPASPRWTMSLGLSPLSNVDYEINSSRKLDVLAVDSLVYSYKGSGGINKASFSNGVYLGKDFYVGLETNFVFGAINRDVTTQNFSDRQNYIIRLEDRTSHSGLNFKLGAAWRGKIKKDLFINIGATADLNSNIGADRLRRFEISSGGTPINADTIRSESGGSITLPKTYRLGINLEKSAKFQVSLDYSYTNWTNFKDFSGNTSGLQNAHKIALGAEFIPDFGAVTGYFKKVIYRGGLSYTQMPYTYTGTTQMKDMNLNVGFSFPLRNLSYANVAYSYGKRGTLSTNGIEEVYHKITLGFTLSDLWFQKVKVN
jgi:hypothetical protein